MIAEVCLNGVTRSRLKSRRVFIEIINISLKLNKLFFCLSLLAINRIQ